MSHPRPPEERWHVLEEHRDYALGAVRRIVGDAVDAEDCVQDAMLRLVVRDDLDPARVRSLLTRTATHIAIDQLRRDRSAERATARLAAGMLGEAVSPEQVVSDREDVRRVLAAVRLLPARERQVMTLRLAGLSALETARLLGVTLKSVEGAYTRARARVRLTIGAILAWLGERARRASSPRGEAFAAAVAVIVLLGPLGSGGGGGLGHGPEHGVLGLATTGRAADGAHTGNARPPGGVSQRLGTAPGGGRTTSPAGGGGDGNKHVIFSTEPITIPNPAGPQHPPVLYVGPIGVLETGPSDLDPIGAIQQCLAEGGPRISFDNGGCT